MVDGIVNRVHFTAFHVVGHFKLKVRPVGPGRNQAAHDDVLLQALQRVDLAVDRSVGEHPGGLLERRRREEGAGLQRRLGDAE